MGRMIGLSEQRGGLYYMKLSKLHVSFHVSSNMHL